LYLKSYKHLKQLHYLNIVTMHIVQQWRNSDENYCAHENCTIVCSRMCQNHWRR
jgi:hypothetical protein